MPSSKKRAQGGGRKSNSEPRQQVFTGFGGCNFELSPNEFQNIVETPDSYERQSDLQMNYVVIQNNAGIASNKTIETRENLVTLFESDDGYTFRDACILIKNKLFVALSNGDLAVHSILESGPGEKMTGRVGVINNNEAIGSNFKFTDFEYIDNKLVAMSSYKNTSNVTRYRMYTGDETLISNARHINKPPITGDHGIALMRKGNLVIDTNATAPTETCPYRITIEYSFVNKYGPTQVSDARTFYASKPVNEWNSKAFLQLNGHFPYWDTIGDTGVIAVEIYYTEGNRSTFNFAGRYDIKSSDYPDRSSSEFHDVTEIWGDWTFNWYGDLDSTYDYPVANLLPPDQNFTDGVQATRIKAIDSRLYFWGGSKPQRLWIGGNSGNLFSVSPGTGGGFVDIEPGTGKQIRFVDKYKTQSGNSIVTMLCDSDNSSQEQRYNLVENNISLSNDQSMKSWQSEQVAGSVGCKSYHGAVVCEDGLYSISRYGLALTTMTMEYNSQIRTTYVSDPIKPVFTNPNETMLNNSVLFELDGIIYMALGKDGESLHNMIFCYDIDLKAWWTVTLDTTEKILNMFKVDYEGYQEGIGIITPTHIYMLPTTKNKFNETDSADFDFLIHTGELSTQQPQQGWQHLSQVEFRFDYFKGDMTAELIGIDQFGRKVHTVKNISHENMVYNLAEYMRVDLKLQSYQIRLSGRARFRLTHWISKLYVLSSKQGIVWGFDDRQSFRSSGNIHPTFKDYNDIEKAIIP